MDTPEKTQIDTPLSKSKFEDSPVFNYINSLSPIMPVKSIHITQPFNSLSFPPPSSVFTSPHVSSHKESRFFKSHNSSDPSKLEILSDHGNKDSAAEIFYPRASTGEVSAEQPSENFKMELPQILKYGCVSPDSDTRTCATDTNGMFERGFASVSAPFVQGGDKDSSEAGANLQKMCNAHAKDGTPDWESLISDSAELLIFCSPKDSEAFRGLMQKTSDSETGLCTSLPSWSNQVETNLVAAIRLSQTQERSRNGDANNFTNSNLSDNVNNESEAYVPHTYEPVSNLHRGMRRRCLDFEMLGARKKNLNEGSNCSSSIDSQTMSNKPGSDSSQCVLPSIGLHLNALAMSAKDGRNTNVIHETSHSGKIQIILPSTHASVPSLEHGQESLTSDPAKAETESAEDEPELAEDVSKASCYLVDEELNPASPKKKRRKSEQDGEGEACKRCNCKKSKCLKLYCECFAAGIYCIEPCSCLDCFNKPIHEDTVLATRKQIESRNPLAFAPKVIRSSEAISEIGDDSTKTPASARHKRGCNCKKSNCLKKYCECYQGGVGCSINCRCEGCKNAFGRKDEGEPEEVTETSEKSEMAKTLPTSEIPNEEHNSSSAIPTTPIPLYRSLVHLPFSSKTRPLQSLLGAGSSSSGTYNTQKYRKPNIFPTQSKFDENSESITGDEMEMPDILIRSPIATIKTASPNSKRVSSPHFDSTGSTLGRKSGRKLILQSIPAFPSLTPHH